MPRPFLELNVEEFARLLRDFPWRRRITEVHLHHTYRPNHADFGSRPPIQSIEGMYRFHTEVQHWSDIAQHVTVDPNGKIWTGRNWNRAPASATGFNGNDVAGPFMIEMIGNFDAGNDKWEGNQRDASVQVIALIQRIFGLAPSALRFHHEMSSKSCPGTSLRKSEVVELVTSAHDALRAIPQSGGEEAMAADRLLRLFAVGRESRGSLGAGPTAGEGELPEGDMTLREIEAALHDSFAARDAQGVDDSDLTPEQLANLRKYVINLRMGALSSGGVFQTTEPDVEAIFQEHLPAAIEERKREGNKLKLVFFAHGGLNDEVGSLKNARNRFNFYLQNKCYPIFFVWETGPKETLVDILREIIGLGPGRGVRDFSDLSDAALESAFRRAGTSMWANMKRSAEIAFLPRQGGTLVVNHLAEFWRQNKEHMEIHGIGHSAGSIFHAHFLDLLLQPGEVQVDSLHLLAPAITVQLFKDKLMPFTGKSIKSLTEYTMRKDFELADNVGIVYRKSLLYLVSRSFEDASETPILGLEESLRRDPDMVRYFGLLGNRPKAEVLFSVTENGPSHSTIAKKHGDFDNDRLTMNSVMRRILKVDDNTQIVPFPESVSRNVLSLAPAPLGALPPQPPPAPEGALRVETPTTTAEAGRGSGRKRALCIGIDNYAAPYALSGCVNDARSWRAWLQALGFEVTLQVNEQASWRMMMDSIRNLVEGATPDDVLVLQYSGHGTQVDDLDGDERGGKDSALCPVDFPSGGFLIDDDLRRIFSESLPVGVNLTCFFDCCHSGTITRLLAVPSQISGRGAAGSDVRIRGLHATPAMMKAHKGFREALRLAAPASRESATMKEVSFTACDDSQVAQEINGHGVFTSRALQVLAGGVLGLTNASFHEKVLGMFRGDGGQTPRLDCAPAARARPLIQPLARSGPSSDAGVSHDSIVTRLDRIERRLASLGV